MIIRVPRVALACALALAVSACGGNDSASDDSAPSADAENGTMEDGGSEVPPTSDEPASGGSAATTAPVAAADIDRWQKGMAAELEAVRTAGARMQEAKTNADTLAAMMAVQEMATVEAGADAADLDTERYKFIRSELSAAASYLTPHLGGIDTTMLSPAQREELRQSNDAQLAQMKDRVPAEVVEALRPRAAELRTRDLELVTARLKAAGM